MKKQIKIHSLRMAGWLMQHGVMYENCEVNKKIESKTVFIFPYNERVSEIMNTLPNK